MKYIIFLFSLLFVQIGFAQSSSAWFFYVVKDVDGWVNVRNGEKEIIDQIENNKIVFVHPDLVNKTWTECSFGEEPSTVVGFVHQSRLNKVTNLKNIPLTKEDNTSHTFSNKEYVIKISIEPFVVANRKLKYSKEGDWLISIDGQSIWGVDGGIPRTQYKSIEISKDGVEIAIPQNALHNLFEPTLDNVEVYYDEETNNLYITSLNSDGAGGYVTAWTIENDRYKERLVSNGF